MQVSQQCWNAEKGWNAAYGAELPNADLVLYFAGKGLLENGDRFHEIRAMYPHAQLLGCSTGGEILNMEVRDNTIALAAIKFSSTPLASASVSIASHADSFAAGAELAGKFSLQGLSNIFLLSDGTTVNGSDLVRGLYSVFPPEIIVTGGLAGDAADFGATYVGLNAVPTTRTIAAVGFYGNKLKIGYGSVGGWDSFGLERTITRSDGNILYELDGEPALDLYKKYLGDEAAGLPGSALLYPLSIHPQNSEEHDMVRTVVGIDEAKKAMIFAGDVPEGYIAQLMRGDFDHLTEGAFLAANNAKSRLKSNECSLALLVSCIGRKLLMGQEISEETEAVAMALPEGLPAIGFYSYGEICHQRYTHKCSLHNQTMTVTLLHEQS